MSDILELNRGCHTLRSRDGTVLLRGEYDPKIMFNVLSEGDPSYWKGRRVLDIGCNTGGIALEIARAGADVVAIDPDPWDNGLTLAETTLCQLAHEEGLRLATHRMGMWDKPAIEGFGRFDAVLLLGLIYHFRDPQYVLDYVSTLDIGDLFVSSPTYPGRDLTLHNRRGLNDGQNLPKAFFDNLPKSVWPEPVILTGWHPTHALLERMIRWAGFGNVLALSDPQINAAETPEGWTNSAYYRATKERSVDPDASRREYYPR